MSQIIKIDLPSLSKQKIVEDRGCALELYENHLIYKLKFLASEPTNPDDLEMPWANVDNDYEFTILKKHISAIEKHWDAKQKRWKIVVSTIGMGDDINIFFKFSDKCAAVYKTLYNYICLTS